MKALLLTVILSVLLLSALECVHANYGVTRGTVSNVQGATTCRLAGDTGGTISWDGRVYYYYQTKYPYAGKWLGYCWARVRGNWVGGWAYRIRSGKYELVVFN